MTSYGTLWTAKGVLANALKLIFLPRIRFINIIAASLLLC